jgi:hypothetical protein
MIAFASSSGSVRPNIIPRVDCIGTGLALAGVAGSARPIESVTGKTFWSRETAPMHAPAINQAAISFEKD